MGVGFVRVILCRNGGLCKLLNALLGSRSGIGERQYVHLLFIRLASRVRHSSIGNQQSRATGDAVTCGEGRI
jgi:hypothetical protein